MQGTEHQRGEELDFEFENALQHLNIAVDSAATRLKDGFIHLEEQNRQQREDLEKLYKEKDDQRVATFELATFELLATQNYFAQDQAKDAFEVWRGSVQQWIHNYIIDIFDDNDPSSRNKALNIAVDEPEYGKIFRQALNDDPRLRLAAHLDGTENVIVDASILRWLVFVIFHEGFREISSPFHRLLEDMEEALVPENYSLYARKSWKAQTCLAWSRTSQYQSDKEQYTLYRSKELAKGVGMFLLERHDDDAVVRSIRKDLIEPGLALKEKMMASVHDYQVVFETDPSSKIQEGGESQVDLLREEYKDITNNHRGIRRTDNLNDSNPIKILGVVSPGLVTRLVQAGSKSTEWGDPKVTSKPTRLVAWKEDYDRVRSEQEARDPTFFSRFLSGKMAR